MKHLRADWTARISAPVDAADNPKADVSDVRYGSKARFRSGADVGHSNRGDKRMSAPTNTTLAVG